MGIIKQLPAHEIHKIAAGEVVERPANVVKELVENALDAQATHITVHLESAGKKIIKVTDNGHGMSSEDAHLSILPHTTSKICSVDDLQLVTSFGFRGEALASMAAVSTLTLITKQEHDATGIKLIHRPGQVTHHEEVACHTGTSILLDDLFFNLPARKKFLKSDEIELRAILHVMQAYALAYSSLSFTVTHHNRTLLHCPATTTVTERLGQLFEPALVKASLTGAPITKKQVLLEGVLTNQHYTRYDRNSIYIFVNKRWVKNSKITQAVIRGYQNVLPPQRYPSAVLFITIPPDHIDINIHPRKEEIQFLQPHLVEQLVTELVRTTLQSGITNQLITPATVSSGSSPFVRTDHLHTVLETPSSQETAVMGELLNKLFDQPLERHDYSNHHINAISKSHPPIALSESDSSNQAAYSSTGEQKPFSLLNPELTSEASLSSESSPIPLSLLPEQTPAYRIIGQLHTTYIIIENSDGLLLVDQHAAHERILYELFAHRFNDVAVAPLMFPLILSFTTQESDLLLQYQKLFATYGIMYEQYGKHQFAVTTAPVPLQKHNIKALIQEILVLLQELELSDKEATESPISPELSLKQHHALRAQMACKAAVKAGDTLENNQINELITTLARTENRFCCPHGRPTSWLITKSEIERRFKRIS